MENSTESKIQQLLVRPLDVVAKEPLNLDLLILVLESHLEEGKKTLRSEGCSTEMSILLNILGNSLFYLKSYKELSSLMARIQEILDWHKAGEMEESRVRQ